MLDRRVAIVTGGSSGIGEAAAKHFAGEGAAVAIVGRRGARIGRVADEIRAAGGEALPICADLADASAPERIVAETTAIWGRVDYLVNNAGLCKHEPLPRATQALFDEHIATNVRAPYFLIQQALPYLRASGAGSVVNISSASAWLAIPGQSMYGISKEALQYMTKSLAAELAPAVRINCIAPGPVDTPIHLTWAGDDVAGAYRRMTAELPLARMGRVEEIAAWICWLCSEQASFVTGAVIPVDGGQVLPGALSKISQ